MLHTNAVSRRERCLLIGGPMSEPTSGAIRACVTNGKCTAQEGRSSNEQQRLGDVSASSLSARIGSIIYRVPPSATNRRARAAMQMTASPGVASRASEPACKRQYIRQMTALARRLRRREINGGFAAKLTAAKGRSSVVFSAIKGLRKHRGSGTHIIVDTTTGYVHFRSRKCLRSARSLS